MEMINNTMLKNNKRWITKIKTIKIEIKAKIAKEIMPINNNFIRIKPKESHQIYLKTNSNLIKTIEIIKITTTLRIKIYKCNLIIKIKRVINQLINKTFVINSSLNSKIKILLATIIRMEKEEIIKDTTIIN